MGVKRGGVCTSKQMCVSYTRERKQGRGDTKGGEGRNCGSNFTDLVEVAHNG